MNFDEVRLDLQRPTRLGMLEAVWGEHKTFEQIVAILRKYKSLGENALVTRVDPKKASKISDLMKDVEFHQQARCLTLGPPEELKDFLGEVLILSGGTSDLCVASEAELTLRFHGIKTDLLLDVGVAGLHRLLDQLRRIKTASVLIACAGMEGALPTVLTGLVPQPVIGVPVSVGYGISQSGRPALEGMLASCAPGLVTVNIDNGYGAAMAALRIIKAQTLIQH